MFLSEGFDIIHAHNPPDTFFTVGLFYKIIGKKFIFDHHDLSPELYLTRFGNRKGIIYYGLRLIEKLSLKSADVVIATNESFKRIDCKRGGIPLEKITVLRNGPDLSEIKHVNSCRELIHLNKSIIGYVGEMNPQDGLDYLLRAIKILVYDFGRSDFVCVLIGSGDSFEELKRYSKELKIDPYILFPGYIKKPKLLGYLSAADICVCPDPFNDLNDASTMIKIMEYMALSKPIVAFDLIETRFSAKDAALYVRCNDEIEFAKAIITLLDSRTLREQMGASGYQRVKNILAWSHVVNNLYMAYDSIGVNQPKRFK